VRQRCGISSPLSSRTYSQGNPLSILRAAKFLGDQTSSRSEVGNSYPVSDDQGDGTSLHLRNPEQNVHSAEKEICSRETLNHFRVIRIMAETAFDVISRWRTTSISSSVGGWTGGCSGPGAAELIATKHSEPSFLLTQSSQRAYATKPQEEKRKIRRAGDFEAHLYSQKPWRVRVLVIPVPSLQGGVERDPAKI
jgi:hypothetical protein